MLLAVRHDAKSSQNKSGDFMSFTLSEGNLRRLCEINGFPAPNQGMIFFGLRGCLPLTESSQEFKAEHEVDVAPVDYTHPRCVIGQWLPADAKIALFLGSTVPNLNNIRRSVNAGGAGTNQLMSGYYKDYRKGTHKAGTATAHEAFRQIEGRPIRRTADDFDFDNDDRVEFDNPFDNLHAAWCMGINHDNYSSAGCQVVVGYPKCPQRGNQPDLGPWAVFKRNAYSLPQNGFPYFLLNGSDAQAVAASGTAKLSVRLRFGSQSPLVAELQRELQAAGFYEGVIDENFGERTLRAVLAFQSTKIAPDADDGIVGPMTASVLGMDLPKL